MGGKEIKTIWANVGSRNKENKACLKKEQEWTVQIPLEGGRSENNSVQKGKPLGKPMKVPIY